HARPAWSSAPAQSPPRSGDHTGPHPITPDGPAMNCGCIMTSFPVMYQLCSPFGSHLVLHPLMRGTPGARLQLRGLMARVSTPTHSRRSIFPSRLHHSITARWLLTL